MENLDLSYYAKIHSIESFGTVDGPGIRYLVFMQGCSLRCKYCHNRDTWNIKLGKKVTIQELIEKILRSKPFFEASGGGVTVSGGEPLVQAEFVGELFKELKNNEINTCLDTAGSLAISDEIKKLLKYIPSLVSLFKLGVISVSFIFKSTKNVIILSICINKTL